MSIKALCRRAHVEKVDAGPKGVIIAFRDNAFANPPALVRFVAEQGPRAKVRPGHAHRVPARFRTARGSARGHPVILKNLARLAETRRRPEALASFSS